LQSLQQVLVTLLFNIQINIGNIIVGVAQRFGAVKKLCAIQYQTGKRVFCSHFLHSSFYYILIDVLTPYDTKALWSASPTSYSTRTANNSAIKTVNSIYSR
jgi:hypothetical protein